MSENTSRLPAQGLWWAREMIRFQTFAGEQMHQLNDKALREVEDAAFRVFRDALCTRMERNAQAD